MSDVQDLIRVVIVDDHPLFRQGVATLLKSQESFDICGQGTTSSDAHKLVATQHPDVIILDVEIPGDPAETTVRNLTRDHPDCAIVILTMHDDEVLRKQLYRAGALAYLPKSSDGTTLAGTVQKAVNAIQEGRPPTISFGWNRESILTQRESQVLTYVARASSNNDIAVALNISEGTVKRHTSNIYSKLNATSRIDAVTKARRLGLIQQG